jgi:hypothetical protein
MPETGTTTSASAKTTPTAKKAPEFAEMVRDQVISSVKQTQQLTLDAVETWAGVVGKVIPQLPQLPVSPFLPASSDLSETIGTGFDLAQELLATQRKFAESLLSALVPASA